ncbi:protein FATTY ACID EXPORT 4, chloroplastic [Daucus carota subsp. sativus]|uniref:protein FATTY ACID EXPORT 4, chloroplastic n=1 Tax=Daucus carota subsp. sativus TaxID=79200 RepID=UPI0007E121E8|nr:PREDICTED: protein FATTY ACID EXPORT 4, chloroplastic [Daucus carota subsp. sativus]
MMVCSASSVSVCTLYKHQPLLLHHPPQPKTPPRRPFQLGISVKKTTSISYITKPHHHNSSRFRCTSLLTSEIAPVASAAYGVLLLGGGLFAYTRTQSKGSLFGGLTGAALMGTAYFLMQAHDTQELGEALAFGSALLFASVFGIRLAATRKIVPAGPLLALSLCALVLFLSAYLQGTV